MARLSCEHVRRVSVSDSVRMHPPTPNSGTPDSGRVSNLALALLCNIIKSCVSATASAQWARGWQGLVYFAAPGCPQSVAVREELDLDFFQFSNACGVQARCPSVLFKFLALHKRKCFSRKNS